MKKLLENRLLLIVLGTVAIVGLTIISFNASQTATPAPSPTPPPQTIFAPKTAKMIPPVQDKPVSGQIIVKFNPSYSDAQINAHLAQYHASIINTIEGINQKVVKVPVGQENTIEQELKNDPYVEQVQRDYTTHAFISPDDPLFNLQYALNNTGQSIQGKNGIANADVHAENAWNVTEGNGVKVAILDTGINLNQPDLAGKVILQKSFVSGYSTVEDGNGHGTHVAGLLAADTNNGTGIAGMCPGCQLIIGKILDDSGEGTTSEATDGITWAADNGAKVISMSLGTTDPSTASLYDQAVSYAMSKGAVVVAAAGNDGTSQVNYPGGATGVVSVAATTNTDTKASYSNYGNWVQVAAPGDNLLSTGPTHSFQLEPFGYDTSNPYYYLSGTSMATPIVAGVAALIASTSFATSPQAIINRLYSTADKISGTGTYWVHGRVDAASAVGTVAVASPAPNNSDIITPTVYCVGGAGVPPCATIAPGVQTSNPVAGGASINPSLSANPSGISVNNPVSGGPEPSTNSPSGTPNTVTNPTTPGGVCTNLSQFFNNLNNNQTSSSNAKVHIKCAPEKGGGNSGGGSGNNGGGGQVNGGFISRFIAFLIQLIMQLLQLCGVQTPTTGTPIPSVSPSAAPSGSVSAAPPVSGSPSSGANPSPSSNASNPAPTSSTTNSSCTNPKYTITLDPNNPQNGVTIGNFYLDTDTWNVTNYQVSQTLYGCDYNNWYAVANMNDTGDGAVKTYPDVHEDFNGKPLSSFTAITSNYAHVAPTVGNYDFAYDIWVNGVATSGSTEVMIWTQALGKQADAINGYPSIGTTTISGTQYNVHKNGNGYVALQMLPYKSSGTVDIKAIFNYLISKGVFPASSTLGAIDYGVEIVSTNGTNQTFRVTNFSLTAN